MIDLITNDTAYSEYQKTRTSHWDSIARLMNSWRGMGGAYHRRLTQIYQFLVSPGLRVLEIGCAQGDLLAALKPSYGVGVDFSSEMLTRARDLHPQLHFIQDDAHLLDLDEQFDVIILSDLLNDLWDVQEVFERLQRLCYPHTRVIMNNYSRLWELPLWAARSLGLAKPVLFQNWLTVENTANLLNLAGFEVIQNWPEVLFPLSIALLEQICNRFLVKIAPFKLLALTNFIVARPKLCNEPVEASAHLAREKPVVSVIVPARNEAGNISNILARVPEMGAGTELIFVEGHSQDNTFETIEKAIAAHPGRRCKLFQQTGKGKGDAVRLGFSQASGDILMILDADLTVPPEYLPRFYEALASNKGEFINGVRLVYPMEEDAMRFANLIGNKFFSLAFSWLLGQSINDSLCGTKVLSKRDYEQIANNRAYFGDFDPFGDFDLLFGAAKMKLKIVDLPIRYRERTYGTTNIERWKHGWLLLRMVLFAAGRIKFI